MYTITSFIIFLLIFFCAVIIAHTGIIETVEILMTNP